MTEFANLRSEAAGFITDWLMAPGDSQRSTFTIEVAELDRGARIIEAQMAEIERLQAENAAQREIMASQIASWEMWADLGDWAGAAGIMKTMAAAIGITYPEFEDGWDPGTESKRDELLQLRELPAEIDRLRGLVVEAHVLMCQEESGRWSCSCDERWRPYRRDQTHAAHVAELLDGAP